MSAAIFNYRYAVIISKQWFLLLNTTKIEKFEKGVIWSDIYMKAQTYALGY